MILTIEIESLDQDVIKFYQSNESSKIQDALYHGYRTVKSKNYALNLYNCETNNSNKIQELMNQIESMKSKQSTKVQELTENYRIIVDKQKDEFDQEKNGLLGTISNLKEEILVSHNKMLDTQMEIETKVESKFTEKITNLQNKNEELTNKLINNDITNRTYYDNKEREFKSEINDYRLEIKDLRIKLEERNSILSNSSKKGKEGEIRMEEILNSLFPNAEIYDTHKTTANGDFRIIINGIQILYENKNFGSNNVCKRDIEKFRRDVEISDCHCGIICSENSGIASVEDLAIEIIGESQKPAIFLHNTNTNIDKIRIAVLILCNILENKLDLNTSTLLEIKNLVSDCDEIIQIKNSNKKSIDILGLNNDKLAAKSRKIKYKLEQIIHDLSNKDNLVNLDNTINTINTNNTINTDNTINTNNTINTDNTSSSGSEKKKKQKEKCEYCMKWYVNLQQHYQKCVSKNELEESLKNNALTN